MFGYSSFNKSETEPEPDSEPEDVECEIEKVLKNIDLDEYLNLDETSFMNNLNADLILGNEKEIYQMLKDSLVHEHNLLQDVEKKILEMDYKIEFYKSFFFTEEKRDSKIKSNLFYVKKGFYLTEVEIKEKFIENEKMHQYNSNKKSGVNMSSKKTLENFVYSGFDENQLTEFPGFVEAPQLLNNLSAKMGFKPSFLKYWINIIRSDASCAILLDSFWWFYLTKFKKDPSLEVDAYKYFCRVSESFAALLFNIDTSMRDRFFGNYADFLCQAIYLAFYSVFPDSVLQFNDDFKQDICTTVYEWVFGIRPMPESYLNWKIKDDIKIAAAGTKETKVSSNSEILNKISNLEKMLNSIGEKDREPLVRFEDNQKRLDTKSAIDFSKSVERFYQKQNESHVIGEGAIIEKISFNSRGKSILINHYIKMHNLDNLSNTGFKMTRSEIIKNPPKTAPTYRDEIYSTLQRSKSLEDNLKKYQKESDIEKRKYQKERKKAFMESLRLKRSKSLGSFNSRKKSSGSSKTRPSSIETTTTVSASLNRMDLLETDEENF